MKIKVKDLKPNPFRNIERYPIDRHKIEILKQSINQTDFWDNLVARKAPNGNHYELAYGHHRLYALQELGIEEIDIPIRNLDDATMLRIMANENHEHWNPSPAIINETVLAAKQFLDNELVKYETWEEVQKYPYNSIGVLFNGTKGDFQKAKKQGVGIATIHKFLGPEMWKQWQIQQALEALKDKELDKEAYETFENQTKAKDFQKAVKKAKIPKEKQPEVAKKVSEKLKEEKPKKSKEVGTSTGADRSRSMQELVYEASSDETDEQDAFFLTLENKIERFNKNIANARGAAHALERFIRESEIEEIQGYAKFIVVDEAYEFLQILDELLKRFGVELKTVNKQTKEETNEISK